jgi:prevent-host-death family protein
MKVSVLEAKERLPELIEKARAGEDVVIANDGQEAVRLVPVPVVPAAAGEHPAGSAARILAGLEEMHRLRTRPPRSPEEIEADIQELRNAWD